jgi:hypothetical protein
LFGFALRTRDKARCAASSGISGKNGKVDGLTTARPLDRKVTRLKRWLDHQFPLRIFHHAADHAARRQIARVAFLQNLRGELFAGFNYRSAAEDR